MSVSKQVSLNLSISDIF